MDERRKFVRLDTRLEATYAVLSSGDAQQAVTKNVSGGGICLFTAQVLTPGTQLQVSMKLPGREQPIHCTAEVVWSEPYEIVGKTESRRSVESGVRLVEIAPTDQAAVMQHVILSLQGPRSTP